MTSVAVRDFELSDLFTGRWDFTRRIPGRGNITGRIEFSAIGQNVLLYEEKGIFQLDTGKELTATRQYIYRIDGDKLRIFYHDPFRKDEMLHDLDFNGRAVARHEHVCGNDTYYLTLRLLSFSRIDMEYAITGHETYRMNTILSRAGF